MSKRAPKHLSKPGLDFWKRMHSDFEFANEAEIALLVCACECLDRMDAARKEIKKYGEFVQDRYSQRKANPALDIERQQKALLLQTLKQLGIEAAENVDRRFSHSRHKSRGLRANGSQAT